MNTIAMHMGLWVLLASGAVLGSAPEAAAPDSATAVAGEEQTETPTGGRQWPGIAAGCLGVLVGAWLARRRIAGMR